MRKGVWQLHSWLGLVSGIFLLLIATSGALLVFRPELDRWLHGRLLVVAAAAPRISYDALARRAEMEFPAWHLSGITIAARDDEAATVMLRRGKELRFAHFHPGTGALLGSRDSEDWLVWGLDRFHYTLFAGKWGTVFTGLVALSLIASCVTGCIVHRGIFRRLFTLRWRESARLLVSDMHRLVGVSSLVFNLGFAITGAWMNLPATLHLFDPEEPPPADLPQVALPPGHFISAAQTAFPGFRPHDLLFPDKAGDPVKLFGAAPGSALFFPYAHYVELNATTGEVEKVFDANRQSAWEKWNALVYPLHIGRYGHWSIRALYVLAGLAPGMLAVTGALIYFRRLRAAAKT